MIEQKDRCPYEVERESWKKKMSFEHLWAVLCLTKKIDEHRALHDKTTWLRWSTYAVWYYCIVILRRYGALYKMCDDVTHPMVKGQSVWEVFGICCHSVLPWVELI